MDRSVCAPQPSNDNCGRCSGDRNIPSFWRPHCVTHWSRPAFRSDLTTEISELLEIRMCDGQVERFNHTLIEMLTKLCEERKKNWDDHLPYVMCAYRSTIQESTRSSPNRMMLDREITLLVDLMYSIDKLELYYLLKRPLVQVTCTIVQVREIIGA